MADSTPRFPPRYPVLHRHPRLSCSVSSHPSSCFHRYFLSQAFSFFLMTRSLLTAGQHIQCSPFSISLTMPALVFPPCHLTPYRCLHLYSFRLSPPAYLGLHATTALTHHLLHSFSVISDSHEMLSHRNLSSLI